MYTQLEKFSRLSLHGKYFLKNIESCQDFNFTPCKFYIFIWLKMNLCRSREWWEGSQGFIWFLTFSLGFPLMVPKLSQRSQVQSRKCTPTRTWKTSRDIYFIYALVLLYIFISFLSRGYGISHRVYKYIDISSGSNTILLKSKNIFYCWWELDVGAVGAHRHVHSPNRRYGGHAPR